MGVAVCKSRPQALPFLTPLLINLYLHPRSPSRSPTRPRASRTCWSWRTWPPGGAAPRTGGRLWCQVRWSSCWTHRPPFYTGLPLLASRSCRPPSFDAPSSLQTPNRARRQRDHPEGPARVGAGPQRRRQVHADEDHRRLYRALGGPGQAGGGGQAGCLLAGPGTGEGPRAWGGTRGASRLDLQLRRRDQLAAARGVSWVCMLCVLRPCSKPNAPHPPPQSAGAPPRPPRAGLRVRQGQGGRQDHHAGKVPAGAGGPGTCRVDGAADHR
jgi:hypothetical protein